MKPQEGRFIMKTMAAIGALVALGVSSAQAQTPDLAKVSGTYDLEPQHTEILFGVNHLGFSTYYGSFPGASGVLTLDRAHPEASKVEITIPTAKVWVANEQLRGELVSPQWLDAAKYPTMTFRSTKVARTGDRTADVTGDLTLHGQTHPVTLHATFRNAGEMPMMKRYAVGFEARGEIKRSEWGVAAGIPMVGDDLELIISAPFLKQGG